MEKSVHTSLPPELPIDKSLAVNLERLKAFTGGSSDVIIKDGMLCGSDIAVITCEGMADTDTLAQLIYSKLNNVDNKEQLPPDEIMARLFERYLIAAEQLEISNLGDLTLKMQSGFAIVLVDGCARGIAIGIQGYPSRGVDEPSSQLNVRGSREGFVEVIRRNMALIRRRIKSPTLVFEMSVMGERSNTDICLCYLSDKVSPALLEQVRRRLGEVKLNTILESGYIQPFLEGSGGWFFSECGTCERPDSFAAKLYEGRVGILVDGTPFALTVPYLFIENFQTMDDYTQKPFYALFIRILRLTAYFITLFLPGAYVAVAAYSPEMLPSALILNLAAAEQTAPYSLMAECLLIHFLYEILREAAAYRSCDRCRRRNRHRRHHGERRSGGRADGAHRGAERTVQLCRPGALRADGAAEVHLYFCRRYLRIIRNHAGGGRHYYKDVLPQHLRSAVYVAYIAVQSSQQPGYAGARRVAEAPEGRRHTTGT